MTNKLTDNEIIKALECCQTWDIADCKECPNRNSGNDCIKEVKRNALDLINRLKAENEAVRKDIITAEEYAWKLKAKNEALQMDNEQLKSDIINERMNLEHIQAENEDLEIKLKHFAEFLAEAEKKNNALISAQETLQKHIEKQNAENERLSVELSAMRGSANSYKMHYEKAKAEAIKEFAEKTNEMITEIYNKHIFGNNDLYDEEKEAIMDFSNDIVYGFDNLVKEMVGDTDA